MVYTKIYYKHLSLNKDSVDIIIIQILSGMPNTFKPEFSIATSLLDL